MITKEVLLQIMKQDNAADAIFSIMSTQNERIIELEDKLNAVKTAVSKI